MCIDPLQKRELYAEFLAQVPILQTLTDAERLALVDAIHPLRVARGTVVVTEGELGADRFFMVESGELFGVREETTAAATRVDGHFLCLFLCP